MAHEIKGILYKIKSYYGGISYIECESEEDLFVYLVKVYVIRGYPISSVSKINLDDSIQKVRVLTDKRFKTILKEYQTSIVKPL